MSSVTTYWNGSSRSIAVALGIAGVPLIAIVLWQALSTAIFAIPAPLQTFNGFLLISSRGELADASVSTSVRSLIAFVASVAVGTSLGTALGRSGFWYQVFEPIIVVSAAIPKIIVYPILLLLLGIGPFAVIAMGFIGGVFPVIINVMTAVRDLKPVYARVGRTLGVGTLRSFYRIYLPAVMPSLLAGVRLSFGLTLVNIVIAELFASRTGIGKLIMSYYSLGEFSEMVALILLFFIVSTLGAVALWGFENKIQKGRY